MSAIPFSYEDYHLQVRQDFMLSAIPKYIQEHIESIRTSFEMIKEYVIKPRWYTQFIERLQEGREAANATGFRLTSRSKQRVRAASYSLFLSSEYMIRENLRFVTFTFPDLPATLKKLSKPQQDKALHKIFLKFLDNERKNYGLLKWVWVNELQTETQRNVLHYHSLFSYEKTPDYYLLNLRFINHLRRNGFDIFAYFFRDRRFTAHRQEVVKLLEKSDYNTFSANRDYTRYQLTTEIDPRTGQPQKVSIFFQPVDIEKPKADNIGKVSSYLSKYISKAEDGERVCCRRFGCSRGLVPKREEIFKDFSKKDLLQIFSMQKKSDVLAGKHPFFEVPPKDKNGEIVKELPSTFIYPPKWEIWNTIINFPNKLCQNFGKNMAQLGYMFASESSAMILQI